MPLANWTTESLFPFLLLLLPGGLWLAFWLFAVNWKKVWPELRAGAWAPVVLLGLLSAIGWSQLAPGPCPCGYLTVPNFWWQSLCVAALIGTALFGGWLQGVMGYTPVEVSVEPAAHHGHGHDGHNGHTAAHDQDHSHGHH